MWQLDSAATNASSGSTASSREKGSGTTLGEAEAGDRDAAVEAPFVRAAVAALGEILAGFAPPGDRRAIFVRHRMAQSVSTKAR